MHKDLVQAFENVVIQLKADLRCKGGWHYGSISRNMQDCYSDYDPVFLVEDKYFEDFSKDIPNILKKACDELLIFWAESFNDKYFKNYCSVMKIGDNLHQFDFFVLNEDYPLEWMCRQHLKGCTREHIIFDRTGEVRALLDKGLRTDNQIPDLVRAMDTYWFHTEMLIKYFKRKDMFKLLKNMVVIFHAHVDLLLSQYDTLDYGAWETKVKYCVPEEKQQHLLSYFTTADFENIKLTMKRCMIVFQQDANEACIVKNIAYSDRISELVMEYFHRQLAD